MFTMITDFVRSAASRRHVLLAPLAAPALLPLSDMIPATSSRHRLLERVQRLRGRLFLKNGYISSEEVSSDGRHISPLDEIAWHLVALDDDGDVVGCLRMLTHSPDESFDRLFASHSAIARSDDWGPAVRSAVERERAVARDSGFTFLEIGGWALRETLRCSTEAARLALGVFAFGQLIGGAIGITTATLRNHSASILQRIGGRPLEANGSDIPVYYDPQHLSEMQILRFDSGSCERKYSSIVEHLRTELQLSPVFCASPRPLCGVNLAPSHLYYRNTGVLAASA
jgi:hypothetical protein